MAMFQNVVHGDFRVRDRAVVGNLEIAHEVHRRAGARIGLHLEAVEGERERQGYGAALTMLFDGELFVGDVRLQHHLAVLTGEHRQQRAEQDEQHGTVQGADDRPAPAFARDHHDHHADGQQCPERDEPPAAIDVAQRVIVAVEHFHDGARRHRHDQGDEEGGEEVTERFHQIKN